jgi:hypothetical protein
MVIGKEGENGQGKENYGIQRALAKRAVASPSAGPMNWRTNPGFSWAAMATASMPKRIKLVMLAPIRCNAACSVYVVR